MTLVRGLHTTSRLTCQAKLSRSMLRSRPCMRRLNESEIAWKPKSMPGHGFVRHVELPKSVGRERSLDTQYISISAQKLKSDRHHSPEARRPRTGRKKATQRRHTQNRHNTKARSNKGTKLNKNENTNRHINQTQHKATTKTQKTPNQNQ